MPDYGAGLCDVPSGNGAGNGNTLPGIPPGNGTGNGNTLPGIPPGNGTGNGITLPGIPPMNGIKNGSISPPGIPPGNSIFPCPGIGNGILSDIPTGARKLNVMLTDLDDRCCVSSG